MFFVFWVTIFLVGKQSQSSGTGVGPEILVKTKEFWKRDIRDVCVIKLPKNSSRSSLNTLVSLLPPALLSSNYYACVFLTWVWCCSVSSGSRSCGRRAGWPPASPEDKQSSDTTRRSPSLAGGSPAQLLQKANSLIHTKRKCVFLCVQVFLWGLTLEVLGWEESFWLEDAGVPVAEPAGSQNHQHEKR